MSIDTAFIQLQINLIHRLFHEMQWGHTSHSIDVFYNHIKQDLKSPLDDDVLKVIDEVQRTGGINKYEIIGEIEGSYSVTESTIVLFDIDEEKLDNYLRLLEFQMRTSSNSIFRFKFKITIDFREGVVKHGKELIILPMDKNGIKLLSLMLSYYPNFVRFEQIDNEFGLTKIREDDPRLADKRIYEIRDDLLDFLIKKVHLSTKIAKQFVTNIRGIGYKIAIKSDI